MSEVTATERHLITHLRRPRRPIMNPISTTLDLWEVIPHHPVDIPPELMPQDELRYLYDCATKLSQS